MNRSIALRLLTLSVVLVLCAGGLWAQGCPAYDAYFGPILYSGPTGTKEHSSGGHNWGASFNSGCTYSGAQGPCAITAGATTAPYGQTVFANGTLTTLIDMHDGNYSFHTGTNNSNSPTISADDEGAAAFRSCLGSCGVSISISGDGHGGGFSVSFPSDNIYADQHRDGITCAAKTAPPLQCQPQVCPGREIWDPTTCQCLYVSPIIVDTTGHGFHFTDPKAACVTFNWAGKMLCTSWPEHGSGNAWLVYDRDNDNKIDSADELFGNFTPHSDGDYLPANLPRPNPKNGFMALAYYDQPANGGNQDMVIDARDAIWPKLKLWIDDHCYQSTAPCSALPKELHRPEEFGIHSFGLLYGPTVGGQRDWVNERDQWNNWFRLFAQANPKPHDLKSPDDELNERRVYDVFVVKQ